METVWMRIFKLKERILSIDLVGCEMPNILKNSKALMPSPQAAQHSIPPGEQ